MTTIDWVEGRAGVYRDQANTYTDGRVQNSYLALDTKISTLDSKTVKYTNGINTMAIATGSYNMGRNVLTNTSDGVDARDSVNKQ